MILDIKPIQNRFSFHKEEGNTDHYYCSCGHHFTGNIEDTEKIHEEDTSDDLAIINKESYGEEYLDAFKDIRMAIHGKNECPSCKKDYYSSEHKNALVEIDDFFAGGFEVKEDDQNLFLYFSKIKVDTIDNKDGVENIISYSELARYIRLNKKENRLYFKNFHSDNEEEFDLHEIIKVLNVFFSTEVTTLLGIFNLHEYIDRLSNNVIDSKSIDIIQDLIGNTRNVINNAGINEIKKVITVFFGIIKYSNLSTIAMTKGSVFLYDIMLECKIPSSKELRTAGVTSPIKIFNFLIKNYIKELNNVVNEENKEKNNNFTFKSSVQMNLTDSTEIKELKSKLNTLIQSGGDQEEIQKLMFKISKMEEKQEIKITKGEEKKLNINFKDSGNGSRLVNSNGRFQVLEAIEDGSVSKFMFKKVNKFEDYKQLIKYFKFADKHQLINLLNTYSLDFLKNVIDKVYFRDDMTMKELKKFMCILEDYSRVQTIKFNKSAQNSEDIKIDYKYIQSFDFAYYDDSLMMIEFMKFDRKKEFDRIKTFEDLVKYHDNMVKYYAVNSDPSKMEAFDEFVSKFSFLEDTSDYDGPLKVEILKSPEMVIMEGRKMKHSAHSYSPKMVQGIYLLCRVFDEDPNRPSTEFDRFTLGFNHDDYSGLVFHAVKSYGNQLGTDRFKQHMIDYLEAKSIPYEINGDLRQMSQINTVEEVSADEITFTNSNDNKSGE